MSQRIIIKNAQGQPVRQFIFNPKTYPSQDGQKVTYSDNLRKPASYWLKEGETWSQHDDLEDGDCPRIAA